MHYNHLFPLQENLFLGGIPGSPLGRMEVESRSNLLVQKTSLADTETIGRESLSKQLRVGLSSQTEYFSLQVFPVIYQELRGQQSRKPGNRLKSLGLGDRRLTWVSIWALPLMICVTLNRLLTSLSLLSSLPWFARQSQEIKNLLLLNHFSRVWPHRRQPTRLPRPWDSPNKNTAVGCHFLLQCMKVKKESEVAQSCLTLSDPVDCSPPGSSVHGIFQARVLEWGAIAFSD